MYKFMLLIRCVQIYICILLAFVKLMYHFLFVFVWRHCNWRRKRLASKFKNFARISPTAKWIVQYESMSWNMTIYHKKRITNVYGFIILFNYITSVFHWNITIRLAMKWSHDYKRDVLHPNKTQTRTCTCFHDYLQM